MAPTPQFTEAPEGKRPVLYESQVVAPRPVQASIPFVLPDLWGGVAQVTHKEADLPGASDSPSPQAPLVQPSDFSTLPAEAHVSSSRGTDLKDALGATLGGVHELPALPGSDAGPNGESSGQKPMPFMEEALPPLPDPGTSRLLPVESLPGSQSVDSNLLRDNERDSGPALGYIEVPTAPEVPQAPNPQAPNTQTPIPAQAPRATDTTGDILTDDILLGPDSPPAHETEPAPVPVRIAGPAAEPEDSTPVPGLDQAPELVLIDAAPSQAPVPTSAPVSPAPPQ